MYLEVTYAKATRPRKLVESVGDEFSKFLISPNL